MRIDIKLQVILFSVKNVFYTSLLAPVPRPRSLLSLALLRDGTSVISGNRGYDLQTGHSHLFWKYMYAPKLTEVKIGENLALADSSV